MSNDDEGIARDLDDRTADQPLNARRRSFWGPLLITVLVLALVIGVMVLITFVADYNATDG